jgi:hypothetical protein
MPADKWRRCAGCPTVVHQLCVGDLDLDVWKCPSCTQARSNISTSNPTEDCDADERQVFETESDMYTFLRDQGYRTNNTQKTGKTWECSYCYKTFYAKKMKDDRWSCPLIIVHEDKCSRPVKPVVKEELVEARNKGAVQYFHEFGKYPGLLEYIEILGCTDEMRSDQLQRAVSKKFRVHVSAGLLYRTAKNAHDEMFGSNISDIEELLNMSKEVCDEGGFLKLFTGDLSVYTTLSVKHDNACATLVFIQECIH